MSSRFDQVIDRRKSGCFKYDALKMIYGRDDLLSMWVADMDFAVSDEIQSALSARIQHPVYGYNYRLSEFYDAVQLWQERRFAWFTEREWIVPVPGIVPGISLAVLSLTEPGDGVLIQTPVYPPFFSAATDHGRQLLTSSLVNNNGQYSIDWEDFESQLKLSKLFILCSPHNPIGRVWSREELCKIGHLCQKHGVNVISDEIHEDLVYPGFKHIPFASLEDFSEITITGISPAKSFNVAGLATAVLMIPNPKLRKPVKELNEKLHLYMGNSFGIRALIAAYNDSEAWLAELLQYLNETRELIVDYFPREIPNVKVSPIEGTYLVWLDFRDWEMDDAELQNMMLNKALIALEPGVKFGKDGKGFMRLNFGCSRSTVIDALGRIKNLQGML
ncbi:MAG: PatB family C-S lyase [Candidatus Cloacimonetes bacterium]|nr:PatB family C-S lyase [Candidatus Cloacimonadota bacterium]